MPQKESGQMTEHEAYLRQARSDFAVFQLLLEQDRDIVPACHSLHYLQMATEKLAKAVAIVSEVRGFDKYSHVAFSLLQNLLCRADVARKLGWGDFKAYQSFLKNSTPVFRAVDELSPSVGLGLPGGGSKEGPNSQYPWRARDSHGTFVWCVPAEHSFRLTEQLRSGNAAQVIQFVNNLLDRFESIFVN